MCGIVSLCYGHDTARLGYEGGELLKRLEYRGYDSTGGALVSEDRSINLLKAVGAPSKVVPALGIDQQGGQRFIGQVRWATYGAVTQENCQPHVMSDREPFVGAHNGNISNTDTLKTFLTERQHTLLSDNDGEIITHLTEHYYANVEEDKAPIVAAGRAALAGIDVELPDEVLLLIDGARRADAQAEGSYAAAFIDPAVPGVVAVKSGSSLYAGIGSDENGDFVVVSSDLTSVLSKTSMLIPLVEGEGIWYTDSSYIVFTLGGELTITHPEPKQSSLNVADTSLRPGFDFYMDQEIASAPENVDAVIAGYLRPDGAATERLGLMVGAIKKAESDGGRVFLVASGTSYHAAMTGAGFFNDIAHVGVLPVNPGMFRSMYMDSLRPADLVIAITQSGETKDLVDILVDVRDRQPEITRLCLVNNENSRIPQELTVGYLPLLCGPEIAVAATKSFINQLAVLYAVAASFTMAPEQIAAKLEEAKGLISQTLETTRDGLDLVAQRLFAEPSMHILGASLVGLAKEGALKIREVVLNHTEGYDAAEFKHGPNTILGKNTLFSIEDLVAVARAAQQLDAEPTGERLAALVEAQFSNYPLVFVCPPDERDVRITISQIHTHKIRGANVVVLAEENEELRLAAEGVPAGVEGYWSTYVALPHTDDKDLFVFAAGVALLRLAFLMSAIKMRYLDVMGVVDHGVHPDSPKNVSKSITVD